jgi:hypothetical protein
MSLSHLYLFVNVFGNDVARIAHASSCSNEHAASRLVAVTAHARRQVRASVANHATLPLVPSSARLIAAHRASLPRARMSGVQVRVAPRAPGTPAQPATLRDLHGIGASADDAFGTRARDNARPMRSRRDGVDELRVAFAVRAAGCQIAEAAHDALVAILQERGKVGRITCGI